MGVVGVCSFDVRMKLEILVKIVCVDYVIILKMLVVVWLVV